MVTFQNNLNMFSFTLKHHPAFAILLVPLFFFSSFLVIVFIISMMTYFYNKQVKRNIRTLMHYRAFKKVFYHFKDRKGIVDYQDLQVFIDDFFTDPKKIDFDKFENAKIRKATKEREFRHKIRELSHNAKHYKSFMKIKKEMLYKIASIGIDTLLALAPIFIINFPLTSLSSAWYFWIVILSACSMIDPFLCLLFLVHKVSGTRRKIYILKIISSFFIIMLAMVLPIQVTSPELTLEQSNESLFIIFSFLCFIKIITFLDEILMRNKIIYNIIKLAKQTIPFLIKIFTIYFLMMVFYVIIGRFMYGSLINSESINEYESKTGFTLREKYEYFNFNDTFSSFLTLFVIVLQHNWIFVVEMMYFVRPGLETTIYIISFNLFVAFTCTSLILGVISRLIILYFEDDFEDIKQNLGEEAFNDIISQSSHNDIVDQY